MKPYYYVSGSEGRLLNVKHPNLHSAHVESLRLSENNLGDVFEILMCIGTTQTVKPSTFWMDGVTPLYDGFEP